MLFRLPRRCQLDANAVPDRAGFVGCQCRIEPIEHQLRDTLLFVEQRLARGFRRVRGEDRLDAQRAEQLEDFFETEALGFEGGDGIFDTAGLGAFAVFYEVVTTAADAVDTLGEIHHLKPGGKRTHKVSGQGGGTVADTGRQFAARLLVSLAAPDRGYPVELDQLEKGFPTLLGENLAHESTQGVHVIAQRFVLRRKMDIATAHGEPSSLPRWSLCD